MTGSPFRGPAVARAAFLVAVFGWGVGFYGPPVFLFAVQAERGWPLPLVSAAVTLHFLLGAAVVANLPAIHRRWGLAGSVALGGALSGLGVLGWALAAVPWHLFAAAAVSGAGWAMTGGAAINAIIAPWFVRGRPRALSFAYNGASVGGVLFSPLWVALIAALGFPGAAALLGGAMALALAWVAARLLRHGPAALGQAPDGDAVAPGPAPPPPAPALPGRALWRDGRFRSLALATSIGLFAQIGLIAHMVSVLAGPLGPQWAGLAAGMMTACAVLGRTLLGRLLPPGASRRRAAAANHGVQVLGSLVLALAGAEPAPLLLGVALFGLGLGNATSLPPLIAQQDFDAGDTGRVVALVTALSQAAYAFAPAGFGLLLWAAPGAGFWLAGALQALAALVLLRGIQPKAQR